MIANLSYIQKQMQGLPAPANFIADWKALSDEDKETLKQWAQQEQEAIEAGK